MFSQVSLLLLASASIVAAQPGVHVVGDHYTLLTGGVCRGPGGVSDRINGMSAVEHTQLMCEEACDSRMEMDENGSHCKGYSYCSGCNQGECLLFGPGLDGTCSDPSADNKMACDALGSCDAPTAAIKEAECGVCAGKPSALEDTACESIGGVWEKGTWTNAGAVWSGAETPFTGDSHPSKFIAATSDELNSDYSCYDIIVDDHLAQCTGDAAECTAAFDAFEDEAERIAENCPEGCTYAAKPRGPKNPPVAHAPDIKLPGWNPAQSGACRGGADFSGKVNGKYSNTAGADGKLTQLECAEACVAEETCVGYAHSTAWCVVYGPGIHEGIGTEEGGLWTSDNHEEIAITGTKVNIAYLCVTGPPRVATTVADNGGGTKVDDEGGDEKDSDSGSSAMSKLIAIALSFLTAAVAAI